MYKLYDFLLSGNCYKILLLLNQLGIDYERVNIGILHKQSRTLEFLKINSNGRTPFLFHGGKQLAESNAILWYFADLRAIGCAEVRITSWMVCSRATQVQLPSASILNVNDGLPVVSTSYNSR